MGTAPAATKNTSDTNDAKELAVFHKLGCVKIYPVTSLEQATARNEHSIQQRRMPRAEREIIETYLCSNARRLLIDRAQYSHQSFELDVVVTFMLAETLFILKRTVALVPVVSTQCPFNCILRQCITRKKFSSRCTLTIVGPFPRV